MDESPIRNSWGWVVCPRALSIPIAAKNLSIDGREQEELREPPKKLEWRWVT